MIKNVTFKEERLVRIKRLSMRSMRRGTKEMDIILSGFCEYQLEKMDEDQLDLYEAFLSENDQELYQWITGQMTVPAPYVGIIRQINFYLSNNLTV